MVIFNHTYQLAPTSGFYSYLYDAPGSVWFVLDFAVSNLCKCGVPLFFMISGVTILEKEEPIKDTLKRIPKIAVVLLLFSYGYYALDALLTKEKISFIQITKDIIWGAYPHLWYLYAYISFLVSAPILRRMVKGLSIKNALYFTALAIASFTLGSVLSDTFKYPAWITVNILAYPIVGYFIDLFVDVKRIQRKHIMIMWLVLLLSILIDVILEGIFLRISPGNTSERFMQNFCIIHGIVIFVTTKALFAKREIPALLKKAITKIAECVFGIYLLHIIILAKIPFFCDFFIRIEKAFPNQFGVFIVCALTFTVTAVIVWLLRHIPVCRRLL